MSEQKLSKEELEELNKLEDEAYFELCQIIAQAMQTEDIEWLNTMVSYWKTKYKKVLDNASPSFKKKLDYLLNQFYSEAIRYILSQLKFKEEKAIKNQNKAINELYNILKDNYDLKTLKEKIKKWQDKYPYKSFLKMYQKRIDSITREKNLEENAFDQDKAFRDLYYDVVNRNGTIEELKSYLAKWEENYGINKKFTIDQFIKHQSEVKRYVSDEYLISIAKKDDNILFESAKPIIENPTLSKEDDQNQYSPLEVQASAYSKLLAISKDPEHINDVFNWVYKNRSIKFNDKYKELILSATALNYSPKFLSKLEAPNINVLSSSLSLEEYSNISKIKEYAIISYFNLLLPPEVAASNNYFNNYAKKIYDNSKNLKEEKSEENLKANIKEQPLQEKSSNPTEEISFSNPLNIEPLEIDLSIPKKQDINSLKFEEPKKEALTEVQKKVEIKEIISEEASTEVQEKAEVKEVISEEVPTEVQEKVEVKEAISEKAPTEVQEKVEVKEAISEEAPTEVHEKVEIKEVISEEVPSEVQEKTETEEPLSYDEVVTISPLFFEAIHNLEVQSQLINMIDTSANTYIDISSNEPVSLEETKQRQN